MYKYILGSISIFLLLMLTIEFLAYRTRLHNSQELIKNNDPFSVHPAEATIKILVLGDSTAAGVGALDPNNSIAGRLHQSFPRAQIVNMGETGLKTKGLREKITTLSCEATDLIVLQIGANDTVRFTKLASIEKNLAPVLKTAKNCSSEVILLTSANVGTAPIFPWPLQWLYTRRTLQVRDIFMEQAKQYGVTYIDLFQPRHEDPFAQNPDLYYAADDFHPSDEGYGLWYKQIKHALDKLSL